MTTFQVTGAAPGGSRTSPVPGAPWLPRRYVPRPELWSRLDVATRSAVTVVVAPAGAGKTLGVAGWLQRTAREHDTTWFEGERTTTRDALEAVLEAARPTPSGPRRLPRPPRLVVVDDAQLLGPDCLRLLDDRLAGDPRSLRVLLLTRWDLGLSRLVPELLDHLTVLRGDVLRLSDRDASALAAQHAPQADPRTRDAIVARAGGWCAAIVLAARASAAGTTEDFVRRCADPGPALADLVAGEVFGALDGEERHLLLCTATEPTLTADVARHLTDDPVAGDVLVRLESTGLLVTRVPAAGPDPQVPGAGQDLFRIHPLLLEVARRRLAQGGDDVDRAGASVLRATRLDVAQGRTAAAFRRFLALGEHAAAAAVLAEYGPRLLAAGPDRCVDDFVRQAGPTVEQHPGTWSAIAFSRWSAGDLEGGRHWADRVLRRAAAEPGTVPDLQVASVRLHRSRSGAEPVAEAVRAARPLVDGPRSRSSQDPYLPLVLLELGAAENWLGDLVAAEQHLGECLLVSRSEDLVTVTAEALSHLALTQLMAGREQVCLDLAAESLALAGTDPVVATATRGRATLATRLVDLLSLPGPLRLAAGGRSESPPVPDDLAARFWHRILVSRLALADGSVADAQRALAVPFEAPLVPEHLRVVALMERAAHALITVGRDALREVAVELGDLDAPGERLWLRGAIADLDGDLKAAAASYRTAPTLTCRSQPPTAALSLVCAAQLHDRLGDPETARELLSRAVAGTGSRRHAGPFLGWSVHGTRVGDLLDRAGAPASGWQAELRAAFGDRPSVAALFAPLVATDRELARVVEPRVTPVLSPREHEVLNELARGATYGDIAATLFVSENTVKTHVSSLYAKLSAGRRSEALAVARKMHLL